MNTRVPGRRFAIAVGCLLLLHCSARGAGKAPADSLGTASQMVEASGAAGGFCAVVGARDAELALALARQGPFVVQCLCADAATRERVRKAIRAAGLYGTVSADVLEGGRLPYAESLFNIVVCDPWPALAAGGLSAQEVMRVLAPLGTAYLGSSSALPQTRPWQAGLVAQLRAAGIRDTAALGAGGTWVRVTKPWPADIDEWTHYLHGPDGNPVAQDRAIGPPRRYRWVSRPMFMRSHESDSSVSTLVTARGRLFYIVDQAPISLVGDHPLPDKWFLAARDAFNGCPLWKVPIRRWGWREWKSSWFNTRPGDIPLNIQKRLVAVGDRVYVTLGYQAPVSELDARTGDVLKTYADTERTNEILYLDGTLYLSVLHGDGVKVAAVDAATGKRKWLSERTYGGSVIDYIRWRSMRGRTKPAKLDPAPNIATDGRVVALLDRDRLACLDAANGAEKWRAAFPSDPADATAGGIKAQGLLWVGALIVADGVVLQASPSKLAAFDADTGKPLWSQPKKFIGHLWYEWKEVFVIDGLVWTWGADLARGEYGSKGGRKQRTVHPQHVNGYAIRTGKLVRHVPLGSTFKAHHHHRCYRNKATVRYILASRRGTEYIDLAGGPHSINNWVRGTCHVGMMPANGLQYAPPHPCQCYIDEKLNGFNALAPARRGEGREARGEEAPRLAKGPAYGQIDDRQSAIGNDEDWPAFRHDAMRTGAVSTSVPDAAAPLWRVSVGRKVSAPIAVAGSVFASLVDEHHVVCLDARDGGQRWEFAAGGRIDSPPTWHKGTVIFGSADGWVYCLRAADGQLAWRFRAAPEARQIGAFGQLESAWPVHGSVLVQNEVAYFAAGRSSMLDGGIRVYGLDPATGALRHQATLHGPHYTSENVEANFQLPQGCLPDVLMGDGSHVYMRSVAFDAKLERQKGAPALRTRSGLLDGTYFKRMPWTLAGDYARLIVHDKRAVYYVRMFDSLRGLDPTVYFTPGRQGYLLFAKDMDGKRNTWAERVPIRVRAMALAAGRLFVAGPPDVVDPEDPLGAFEGRKGGPLYVFDPVAGKKLAEHRLSFAPVFNGIAAARGRLYLAEEDGSITCFGER